MQENITLFQMSYFVGRYEVLTQIDKYNLYIYIYIYIQLEAISLNILVCNSKTFLENDWEENKVKFYSFVWS